MAQLKSAIVGASHGRRGSDAATLAMVHVFSHSRHRQHVVTVMTFARVSKIFPWQYGHAVGRATVPVGGEFDIVFLQLAHGVVGMVCAPGPANLFKSEQPSFSTGSSSIS